MKYLIIGPPNCGKSQFAENKLILNYDKLGYFATLPNLSKFQNKIDIHSNRRNCQWIVKEATFDIDKDIDLLKTLFLSCDVVLLDGLYTYIDFCFFQEFSSHLNYEAVSKFSLKLFELLTDSANCWVVVDIDPTKRLSIEEDIQLDVIESFHNLLKQLPQVDVISRESYRYFGEIL